MSILFDVKKSLQKNLHLVTEIADQSDRVQLSNYTIYDYWLKPENRSFDVTVDYDSDELADGITFLRVVETFDPMSDAANGGPPDEIGNLFDNQLNLTTTLPSGWTYNEKTGFVEHQIDSNEFKNSLQKHNLLTQFENELYSIAYRTSQEDKQYNF